MYYVYKITCVQNIFVELHHVLVSVLLSLAGTVTFILVLEGVGSCHLSIESTGEKFVPILSCLVVMCR